MQALVYIRTEGLADSMADTMQREVLAFARHLGVDDGECRPYTDLTGVMLWGNTPGLDRWTTQHHITVMSRITAFAEGCRAAFGFGSSPLLPENEYRIVAN